MDQKEHPLYKFKYCPKCGSDKFAENDFKSKRCNNCGFIYYFNSSAATVAVMINSKREILVATRKENPAKGTFDLPGGFVDLDETAEEAVVREVYEETGLKTDKLTYLFSLPNTYNFSDFEVQTTDMFFLCSIEDDANFIAADDVSDLHFIALSELNPSNFGLQSIRKGIEKLQTLNL